MPAISNDDRGEIIFGAKPLSRLAFGDEKPWRRLYNPDIQAELGLFFVNGRLAGFSGVVDRRVNAKVDSALTAKAPRRRRRKPADAEKAA
jgi:hypothetical protein